MHQEVDHERAGGFAANPEALDHYVGHIVNPALENFDLIASKLFATTGLPYSMMLGEENLPGSAEFTSTCRRVLDRFFEAHHVLTEQQRALVQAVATFRDNLQQSSASYAWNEADKVQSLEYLSTRLEARLNTDGTTG